MNLTSCVGWKDGETQEQCSISIHSNISDSEGSLLQEDGLGTLPARGHYQFVGTGDYGLLYHKNHIVHSA